MANISSHNINGIKRFLDALSHYSSRGERVFLKKMINDYIVDILTDMMHAVAYRKGKDAAIEDVKATINELVDEAYEHFKDEAMSIDGDEVPIEDRVECLNCLYVGHISDHSPSDIEDLSSQLIPGEEVPAGYCPYCGSLLYVSKPRCPDRVKKDLQRIINRIKRSSDKLQPDVEELVNFINDYIAERIHHD